MARYDGGPRHRARTRGRDGRPVLIAASLSLALLTTWNVQTTGALWTSSASVEAGGIEHGTLDLQWNAETDDDLTLTGFALSGMYPGDSRAVTINAANASDGSPMAYTVYARGTNPNLAGLTVQVFLGGTATNGGSAQAGYTSSCSGTALATAQAVGTSDAAVGEIAGPLAPGSTHTLCVRVQLAATSPASAQGQSGQIILTAIARQLER